MVKQMVDLGDFGQMLIGLEVSFAYQAQLSHDHSSHMIIAVTLTQLSHDHSCHIITAALTLTQLSHGHSCHMITSVT